MSLTVRYEYWAYCDECFVESEHVVGSQKSATKRRARHLAVKAGFVSTRKPGNEGSIHYCSRHANLRTK